MSFIDNYGEWDDDDWDGIEEDDNLLDDYPEDEDVVCYLGHPDCYDNHDADRRADEADYEEEMRREGL